MIVHIIRLTSLLLLQKKLPSVSEQTTGTMMGKEDRKSKAMSLTQGAFKLFKRSFRKETVLSVDRGASCTNRL